MRLLAPAVFETATSTSSVTLAKAEENGVEPLDPFRDHRISSAARRTDSRLSSNASRTYLLAEITLPWKRFWLKIFHANLVSNFFQKLA